jgi:undecaprenyl diphosphate synthase
LNSKPGESLECVLKQQRLPRHVAIIMDGNGRWAKKRLLNRIKGHEQGAETVRNIVKASREVGIPVLTLYAFSTENWQRPKVEVQALMALLESFLTSEEEGLVENGIRFNTIGEIHRLPESVFNKVQQVKTRTKDNGQMVLNLALSYGARAEIVRMVRSISDRVKEGILSLDSISEDTVSAHLYTGGIPDPDLLIRTSGEMRISNFLLWQIAYAEIYFTNTLWPDFSRNEYLNILIDYQNRERRFGAVSPD